MSRNPENYQQTTPLPYYPVQQPLASPAGAGHPVIYVPQQVTGVPYSIYGTPLSPQDNIQQPYRYGAPTNTLFPQAVAAGNNPNYPPVNPYFNPVYAPGNPVLVGAPVLVPNPALLGSAVIPHSSGLPVSGGLVHYAMTPTSPSNPTFVTGADGYVYKTTQSGYFGPPQNASLGVPTNVPVRSSIAQSDYRNSLTQSGFRKSLLEPYRHSTYPEFNQVEDFPDRANLINSINESLLESDDKESLLAPPLRISIVRQSVLSPAQIEVESLIKEKNEDGSIYEGEAKEGKRHGKGKITYKDGRVLNGEFVNGKAEGKATLTFKTGKVCYDGNVKDNLYDGHGILHCETPQPLDEACNFRDLNEIGNHWIKFEGEFKEGKKHGSGILYLTSGERFVGNWRDDNIYGKGVFHTRDGREIEGTWKNGKMK